MNYPPIGDTRHIYDHNQHRGAKQKGKKPKKGIKEYKMSGETSVAVR